MDKYHVTTIRHPENTFPFCFREMSRLIQWGLQELGADCTRSENHFAEDRVNVVFGFHEWFHADRNPLQVIADHEVIIYQAEQLQPGGRKMPDWYFAAMQHCRDVWDYSLDNVAILQQNDFKVAHVPPAWHEKYDSIHREGEIKDTDVIFTGALNPRRQFMLAQLSQFCSCHALTQCWGMERDEYLARCKIGLNLHYYASQTLELLRIAHMLNSAIPVISEPADNNLWEGGLLMVPYQEICATVVRLLQNNEERLELGLKGQEVFRATSMADVIQKALSRSDEPTPYPDAPPQASDAELVQPAGG